MSRPTNFSGAKVTIFGLGRHGGGVAAAKYLAAQGAQLTITDLQTAEQLAPSLAELSELGLFKYHLGEHQALDFTQADVVVVNPAVRPTNAWLALAKQRQARITSEIELFLQACPAPVVGVTGTVGKSTTATLLHKMLVASGRRAWLGGNIGGSLLGDLPQISKQDIVILELSSFQLEHLSEGARWPEFAVVTPLSHHHLDWHETAENYYAAKRKLTAHLTPQGWLVTTRETATSLATCRAEWDFATDELEEFTRFSHLNLLVRRNAALAMRAALRCGGTSEGIFAALKQFQGLPHRLEFLGQQAGRLWFDDSKSTSLAATLGALECLSGRVWVILGGVAPPGDLAEFAQRVAERTCGAALIGDAAAKLAERFSRCAPSYAARRLETLANAVSWLCQASRADDIVLLSPACASHDQYLDFAARGQSFHKIVNALA